MSIVKIQVSNVHLSQKFDKSDRRYTNINDKVNLKEMFLEF